MKKALLLLCFLTIVFSCKKQPHSLTKITSKTITIDSSFVKNKEYSKVIAPYKAKMITEINTVISYASKDINRYDGELQSSLGNLLADLCYQSSNAIFNEKMNKNIDFAMFNYGGIRASISKGKVTNKHPFELMPFENSLVVVELTGKRVEELIAYFIQNKRAHPLSKNIELTIKKDDSYELKINGKPFNNTKNYFVLTSDYLQSGGDRMDFFKNPVSIFKTDYKMRHAIIEDFKSKDTLKTALDNRIKIIK